MRHSTGWPAAAARRSRSLAGVTASMVVSEDVLSAATLDATSVQVNSVRNPATDFSDAPARSVGTSSGLLDHTFVPFSVTVLRFGGRSPVGGAR